MHSHVDIKGGSINSPVHMLEFHLHLSGFTLVDDLDLQDDFQATRYLLDHFPAFCISRARGGLPSLKSSKKRLFFERRVWLYLKLYVSMLESDAVPETYFSIVCLSDSWDYRLGADRSLIGNATGPFKSLCFFLQQAERHWSEFCAKFTDIMDALDEEVDVQVRFSSKSRSSIVLTQHRSQM